MAIADHVEPQLYQNTVADWLGPIDLLISCGDLPAYYIDFLISSLGAPMVHVLGNHCYVAHDEHNNCSPDAYPGAYNLHRKAVPVVGKVGAPPVLIAGLEGSPWYNKGPHQYTEARVALNLSSLVPRLLLNKAQSGRYLDILVTHAPARGIHDNSDQAHKGFTSLLPFIERFKPALMLHGHTHRYDPTLPMRTLFKGTEIINAYGHVLLDLVRKDNGAGWELKQTAESKKE